MKHSTIRAWWEKRTKAILSHTGSQTTGNLLFLILLIGGCCLQEGGQQAVSRQQRCPVNPGTAGVQSQTRIEMQTAVV